MFPRLFTDRGRDATLTMPIATRQIQLHHQLYQWLLVAAAVAPGSVLFSGVVLSAAARPSKHYVPVKPSLKTAEKTKNNKPSVPSKEALPKTTASKTTVLKIVPTKAVKTAAPTIEAQKTKPSFERDVAPIIKQYCLDCHGAEDPSAGIALNDLKTAAILKHRDVWDLVAQNVDSGHMPPKRKPGPTRAQRDRLVEWIQSTLSAVDCNIEDPGHITLHRLNREEYNNTIRDLVGVDFKPAADFPSDDVGYGFDNIGDVLSISPLLMEKYLGAAEQITEKAIVVPDLKTVRFNAERLDPDSVNDTDGGNVLLGVTGSDATIEHEFARDGDYIFRVRAFGQQFGPEPVRMSIRLDGKELRLVDVKAEANAPATFEETINVKAGKHKLSAVYTNNYKVVDAPDPKDRGDRNLLVEFFEVTGPLGQPELPSSHRRIIFQQPTETNRIETARTLLRAFARRAYRRPVSDAEVERLLRYVTLAQKQGESFERGIQLAVQAILTSPHFLFRVETDPKVTDDKKIGLLDDYQLASRLSYFLWSSMPDEELFQCAERGELKDPVVLEKQARRMLKDVKARALADNFASQWLTLRNLDTFAPDPDHFPNFTDALRLAMRKETELFFQAIVREDRSIMDFLDARFTFLNEPLARHYGIKGVYGNEFRRVVFDAIQSEQRGGLLTQASVLTVTSNPTRTSPVKRGKWVLETIFGTPPPPPPPGVPELEETKKAITATTVRQRLEEHRKNPACASCHARMDGIGFGLENYDAVGAWRTRDGNSAVDSSGTLTSGESFQGATQLKTILKSKKNEFATALSAKLLTYALGRGLESYDKCVVQDIVKYATQRDYRFSALVIGVVQSDAFRKRRSTGGKVNE